ncbi:hypothetical protein BRPE64_ACDS08800 [Caballeronia insecticola]|uniref:Uncharacterized protein n=1 Tax=Caballeronia insecticola TaxID=758793 RepID=R4WG26_9BURK|nr:hypothetical protein BRPE64_ACDS08800 [Caballeronia insecticola]
MGLFGPSRAFACFRVHARADNSSDMRAALDLSRASAPG